MNNNDTLVADKIAELTKALNDMPQSERFRLMYGTYETEETTKVRSVAETIEAVRREYPVRSFMGDVCKEK